MAPIQDNTDGSDSLLATIGVPSTREPPTNPTPVPNGSKITLTLCLSPGTDYPHAIVSMPDSNKIMSVARLAFKDYLSPDQIIELGAPEKMIDGGIRWVNIFDWDYIMLPGSEAGVFLKGSKMHEFPYTPAPTTSRHLAQPSLALEKTKVVTVKDWNANPDLTVMWAFSLSTLEDDVRAFFDPTDNDSLTHRLDVERVIAGQKVWVRIPNWLALYGLVEHEYHHVYLRAALRSGKKWY